MSQSPVEVVKAILANPTDLDHVSKLVAPDATYVSLNFDNPELKQIMPWCGTQTGPEAIVSTYRRVLAYWTSESFEPIDVFSEGGKVAMFGRFSYRSTTLGKAVTSPFAILAHVEHGRVTYMQFMEDTFGTSQTFRSRGDAVFHADPEGGEVTIGA